MQVLNEITNPTQWMSVCQYLRTEKSFREGLTKCFSLFQRRGGCCEVLALKRQYRKFLYKRVVRNMTSVSQSVICDTEGSPIVREPSI